MEEINEELKPHVVIIEDGPIVIEGPIKIAISKSNTVVEPSKCFLCRCGASNKKPYCDGTHKKINFQG